MVIGEIFCNNNITTIIFTRIPHLPTLYYSDINAIFGKLTLIWCKVIKVALSRTLHASETDQSLLNVTYSLEQGDHIFPLTGRQHCVVGGPLPIPNETRKFLTGTQHVVKVIAGIIYLIHCKNTTFIAFVFAKISTLLARCKVSGDDGKNLLSQDQLT